MILASRFFDCNHRNGRIEIPPVGPPHTARVDTIHTILDTLHCSQVRVGTHSGRFVVQSSDRPTLRQPVGGRHISRITFEPRCLVGQRAVRVESALRTTADV